MCVCGACCACVEAGCCAVACCTTIANRTASKYIYAVFFVVVTILAWIVRDYSSSVLSDLSVLSGCDGSHNCLGAEGVLRISLGLTLFFLIMFATTVGTTRKSDWRDSWHNGWWAIKLLGCFLLCFVPFWIPSAFFNVYAEIARFGAAVFLLILIVSIINFIYVWNDYWVENAETWWLALIVVSLGAYMLTIAGIIIMYIWFAPTASCGVNIFFITFCLFMVIVVTSVSLMGSVNAGLMSSSCVSVYLVYLCWAAIMSEPVKEACNTRPRASGQDTWIIVVSFVLGFCAIIVSVFATGLDSKTFSLTVEREASDDEEVPYGYGFFHFVFALGSMYMAMLFLGWDLTQTSDPFSLASGWISVWVQIVASWITGGLYLWTMIAPLMFSDREFK